MTTKRPFRELLAEDRNEFQFFCLLIFVVSCLAFLLIVNMITSRWENSIQAKEDRKAIEGCITIEDPQRQEACLNRLLIFADKDYELGEVLKIEQGE